MKKLILALFCLVNICNVFSQGNDWHNLKLQSLENIFCVNCEKWHCEKEITILSINSDTIYWISKSPEYSIIHIGEIYAPIHYGVISFGLKNNNTFKNYMEIWRDSIKNSIKLTNEKAFDMNLIHYIEFKNNVHKKAPNGFIDGWGWNLNSVDGVEPHFSYYNTSYKVIKYIDFYFSIYNPVGDKCLLKFPSTYIGKVRGVGPVEPWDGGSWAWDRATHYTSADASEMRIVKIVIYYMDGTIKTLMGKNIIYG